MKFGNTYVLAVAAMILSIASACQNYLLEQRVQTLETSMAQAFKNEGKNAESINALSKASKLNTDSITRLVDIANNLTEDVKIISHVR